MAPVLNQIADLLTARETITCPNGYYFSNGRCYSSGWWNYGRWILLAVIIILAVLFAAIFSHSQNRRRRGLRPMYGMGWMAPGPKPGYYNNANTYQPPPPPPEYSTRPMQNDYTGQTFNPNDGYYGNQEGIQLEQPSHSYQRDVYQPPAGPPPSKV